jgi:hypothetical protein
MLARRLSTSRPARWMTRNDTNLGAGNLVRMERSTEPSWTRFATSKLGQVWKDVNHQSHLAKGVSSTTHSRMIWNTGMAESYR